MKRLFVFIVALAATAGLVAVAPVANAGLNPALDTCQIITSGQIRIVQVTGDGTVVEGTRGNDTIQCNTSFSVTINGGQGNDFLQGSVGNDTINGGQGNDTLNGFVGDDTLNGGQGIDAMFAGVGTDACFGGPGADPAPSQCEIVELGPQ